MLYKLDAANDVYETSFLEIAIKDFVCMCICVCEKEW